MLTSNHLPAHILFVEDHESMRQVTSDNLRRLGYVVTEAGDGQTALRYILHSPPDLVVLDLMLPVLSGWDVCRQVRHHPGPLANLPIVMLSAKHEEEDRVRGFHLGADDYLTKPFVLEELTARVNAVLRRSRTPQTYPAPILQAAGIVMDRAAGIVTVDGRQVTLPPREWDLLECFLRHPGGVLSRQYLLNQVWGWEWDTTGTVPTTIGRLRTRVEPNPHHPCRIITVWRRGYRLQP